MEIDIPESIRINKKLNKVRKGKEIICLSLKTIQITKYRMNAGKEYQNTRVIIAAVNHQ